MKIFLVAGELSGDTHGANLITALKKIYPDIELLGTGGKKLLALGQKQIYSIDDMSIIGFVQVLVAIRKIFKMLKKVKEAILSSKPDIIILVDYPGFNIRIAKSLKGFIDVPLVYYIPPQFWVWNYKRVYALRDYTDLVISILPHESEILKTEHVNVKYVGNPVIDNFKFRFKDKSDFISKNHLDSRKEIIGILPGSRKSELKLLMPTYLLAIDKLKDRFNFIISRADSIDEQYMQTLLSNSNNITALPDAQYDIMRHSDYLWVCSGTATLESAIFQKPFLITYRASWLNITVAKMVSKLRTIGLPNIILGYELLPEIKGRVISDIALINATEYIISNKENIVTELKKVAEKFTSLKPSDQASIEISALLHDWKK